MTIWLQRLLLLQMFNFLWLFFITILYTLYLFYILKLQKLLVYRIFHYLILYYELLNIGSWSIHLLLIVKIIARLSIERSTMTVYTCLNLSDFGLCCPYEYWWYWWKVTIKGSLIVVVADLFVILTFGWLLVMTLN